MTPLAQVQTYLAQVPKQMAQVPRQTAQVPKQGRNLRRKSAFYTILMAQVPCLKWNLLHPCRNLRHPHTGPAPSACTQSRQARPRRVSKAEPEHISKAEPGQRGA